MRFELMAKVNEWINESEVYAAMDKFQKEKYKRDMMDNAEKLLRVRMDQRHKKKIKKIKKFTSPNYDY